MLSGLQVFDVGGVAEFAPLPSRARQLARLAVEALLDEARLTPKPALVDRRGCGAHGDLSLGLMEASALALEPYFAAMANAALHSSGVFLREALGALGRRAEWAMMEVTGGANTHRGAIWALGLLVAGAMGASSVDEACEYAAGIAALEDKFALAVQSHGRAALLAHGAGGAKAEAVAGFPHARERGLSVLRAFRGRGIAEECAQVDALMSIMSSLEDTCLLHRGGLCALRVAQGGAREVLTEGGSSTAGGARALRALDASLMRLWASPGGSADLLAATLFLDRAFPEVANA